MWRGAVICMICGPPSDDLRMITLAEPLFPSPEPVEVNKAGEDCPRAPSLDEAPPFVPATAAPVTREGTASEAFRARTDCPCSPPLLAASWTVGLSTCLVASGMLRSSRTCCSPLDQYQINVSNVLRVVKQGSVRFKREVKFLAERDGWSFTGGNRDPRGRYRAKYPILASRRTGGTVRRRLAPRREKHLGFRMPTGRPIDGTVATQGGWGRD